MTDGKIKKMVTELLVPTDANIDKCAALIRSGEIVAFPTETVYGLGGNAFSSEAVKKIFVAKGRPLDKPLIVHVSSKEQINLCAEVNATAEKLIEALMPGALTIVLKKKPIMPVEVTAGGDTVGVRMPNHSVALSLIRKAGVPVAAPSANTSFRPSPTMAQHVYDDLNGKIPAILDGGRSALGMESTIISLAGEPKLLRAGSIPLNEIEAVIGKVNTDTVFSNEAASGKESAQYIPKINMIFSSYFTGMANNINSYYDQLVSRSEEPVIFCLDDRIDKYANRRTITMGKTVDDYAHNLFERIREAEKNYTVIIAEGVPKVGLGVSLISRLVKLSCGRVI